jgi:hypothetical protein
MGANRTYKNAVFTDYFNDKSRLIRLYNAVMDKNVPPDAKLEINTLKGVLNNDRMNDMSFLLDERIIVLIEAQTSANPNMPLRLLEYVARLYENIIDGDAIYKKTQLYIPKPEFIILYNGIDPQPEQQTLCLSDAFLPADTKETLELTATVYNVNDGHNPEILQRCKDLQEYAAFIAHTRKEYALQKENAVQNGIPLNRETLKELRRKAMHRSIIYCMENDVMADYLSENGGDIMTMIPTEWNLDGALSGCGEE